jgi:hypothetical protein
LANGDLPHEDGDTVLGMATFLAATLSGWFDDFEWPEDQDYFRAY